MWHAARLIKDGGCVYLSMDTMHLKYPWPILNLKTMLLLSHYYPADDRPPKWQFRMEHFQISEALLQDNLEYEELQLEIFIDKVCKIAKETIPKDNPNPEKPQKIIDECKQAILEQRQSIRTISHKCKFT